MPNKEEKTTAGKNGTKGRKAKARGGRITANRIHPEMIIQSARDDGNAAGATVLFIGNVRSASEKGRVKELHYESYAAMAEEQMARIEEEVLQRWTDITRIRTVHRIGRLLPGDTSVLVCVSAPHRAEAFEACEYAIERIKHSVPIWKKEILFDGTELWVEGNRIKSESA